MAEASVREQRGAGLDRCSPDELEAFRRLNAAYLARFGHPFIIAVAGLSRADILAAFADRLENDPETEFATAIAQIHRIAGFRLAARPGMSMFDDLRRHSINLAQPRLGPRWSCDRRFLRRQGAPDRPRRARLHPGQV